MNLDGLDVFVKVIQSGSFSGAARLLNMPVTTVSGKIANLEKRLGVTLIHRTTRKLNLTQSGEIFFKRCVRALDEVQAAENELANNKAEPEDLLRITAPVDVGHTLLVPIVRSYLKAYPKTQIETILTSRVVDLVSEGVDLAIRVGKLKDSNLIARKYIDTQANMWASSAYIKRMGLPRHPRDLKDHDFVRFSHLSSSWKLSNGKENIEVPSSASRIITDDIEMVKIFILAGDGIGMMPGFMCKPDEESGKIVRILPNWTWGSLTLSFVYPPQRFVSPKIKTFIDWALKPEFTVSS